MDSDDRIVEAARAVRPYVDELSDEAAAVDEALVEALGLPPPERDELIVEIFDSSDELRDWFAAFVETGLPPDVVGIRERAIEPLPGPGGPVEPLRYACPNQDYVVYKTSVGRYRCPTHRIPLVQQEASGP
ncbi:MAG: hypothetical protein OEV40_14775 [Acidimicrobiia bacterium]|nr:hypothetical protein [Acidimicrobiia bacterium]